jgi:hypothetical protein
MRHQAVTIHWAFNILAGLSLLLCLAACVLWPLSHVRGDGVRLLLPWGREAAGGQPLHLLLDLDSCVGQVEVSWRVWTESHLRLVENNVGTIPAFGWQSFDHQGRGYKRSYPPTRWNPFGFGNESTQTHSGVWFPYYFATLLTAALPLLLLRRRWLARTRRLRLARGLCPWGTYDLRATPEPGRALLDRCPECGQPAERQRTTTQ